MTHPAPPGEGLKNQVTLEGTLLEPVVYRTTPTGQTLATLVLEQVQDTLGKLPVPRLALKLTVVALGRLADQCRPLQTGQSLHVEGSLNQKRWIRDGKVRWGKMELLARIIVPQPLSEPPVSSTGRGAEPVGLEHCSALHNGG